MKLATITIKFGKDDPHLNSISISKIKQKLPFDQFLSTDRASFTLFDQTPIAMRPRAPHDNPVLWGGAMGIYPPTNKNLMPINPAVFAINLQNTEVFPKARLLTYDRKIFINDYLGDDGSSVAKRWLNKRWSFGPFCVSRSKAIPTATHFYKIGIDFSTDQGDGNVYHWTVRVLPKIKLVRLLPESIPLVFSQKPTAMQIESLKIFNVKNPILVLSSNEVTAFETYLLVEGPWAGAHIPQLDFLRENFHTALPIISQNHARQIKGNRLFIYREEKWARHLSNRNEIKEYLSGQGFKMYSIDNISIQETIAIFSSADEIVFEHGAAGVWLIFAKPSIKIVELLPERNHITSKTIADFFYWQCQALKQNHQYILGQVNSFEPRLTYSIELKKLQQLIDV
jgi:hypothetical protein